MINQGSPRDFGVPHLPATPNYQSWRLVPSAHCSWWLLGVPRQGHLVISHSNGSHTAPFSSMFDDFFLSDFPELCLPEAMDFQNFLDLKWWYPEIWGWVKAYGFPSWMKNHILPASTSYGLRLGAGNGLLKKDDAPVAPMKVGHAMCRTCLGLVQQRSRFLHSMPNFGISFSQRYLAMRRQRCGLWTSSG